MNILVTGAQGQLGSEIRRRLETLDAALGPVPEAYRGARCHYAGRAQLDITDERAVQRWFAEHEPYDLVINCASATNVDGCERDEDRARLVNATAVRHLAVAAQRQDAKFVQVSTDYVFAGTSPGGYVETDPTGPLSAYGRTKLEGERYALELCSRSFVVRTAWLYGRQGGNFVKTMLRLGSQHPSVTVVDDQFGSPTCADDLSYEILSLGLTSHYGVFHCTGTGTCSWYEFARAIMERARPHCTVIPCSTLQYQADHPTSAPRPAHSALRNLHLEQTIGNRMRPWLEALTWFLESTGETARHTNSAPNERGLA